MVGWWRILPTRPGPTLLNATRSIEKKPSNACLSTWRRQRQSEERTCTRQRRPQRKPPCWRTGMFPTASSIQCDDYTLRPDITPGRYTGIGLELFNLVCFHFSRVMLVGGMKWFLCLPYRFASLCASVPQTLNCLWRDVVYTVPYHCLVVLLITYACGMMPSAILVLSRLLILSLVVTRN